MNRRLISEKMPRRYRIIMVKRERERSMPINLPNRRTCIAKYKRMMCDEIPPNIRLRRLYRQRATPQNRRQ